MVTERLKPRQDETKIINVLWDRAENDDTGGADILLCKNLDLHFLLYALGQ